VTLAVNPKNRSIVTNMSEADLKLWWTEKMKKLANQYDGRNEVVRGIFLHEHCPVRFNNDYKLRSMTYCIETAEKLEEKMEWIELKQAFIHGLPNLIT